jgi:hypothetical protein
VELAASACSNIIDHAYGGEGIGDIQCSVEILENGLKIILCEAPFVRPSAPEAQSSLRTSRNARVGLF